MKKNRQIYQVAQDVNVAAGLPIDELFELPEFAFLHSLLILIARVLRQKGLISTQTSQKSFCQ